MYYPNIQLEGSKKNHRIARTGQEVKSEPPPNVGENTLYSTHRCW